MILVTGASGFVGGALVRRLARERPHQVRAALRNEGTALPPGVLVQRVGGLQADEDWARAVSGSDVVVHTAARVHVVRDTASDSLTEFRKVNVQGTLALAQQAAEAGVRRFLFISSIKVNGEHTSTQRPFRPDDWPAPQDPYGISKMEAEQGLRAIGASSGMEVVIVRPPLVYGPGVKANFRAMMRWLRRGVPLPLGAIHNQRSLVALDNLVDLIVCCLEHDAAASQTFLVSDGEDLSTTELLRRLGRALGVTARLIPVPAALVEIGARIMGKGDIASRLCGSLQVDISRTREVLRWTPPVSVDDGLQRAADGYLRELHQ
jgi:nucleoside-diphosphate-sugar epimerase